MTVVVKSITELKQAINSGANEIVCYDSQVTTKLKAIKLAKTWGPAAVAGIIVAVPLVITTGPVGAGVVSALAPSATVATSTIIAMIIAVGGVIAISLFSDWDYVEIPGGIKMKKHKK